MRAMNCGSRSGSHAVLPLADAGVREADVLDWWKRQPFDLGIPGYAGNCMLCMLKGRAKLIRLIREDPALADWWIEQEAKVANRTGPDGGACDSMKVFRLGETYAELKAAALDDRDLFDEAASSDENGDIGSLDCHCTTIAEAETQGSRCEPARRPGWRCLLVSGTRGWPGRHRRDFTAGAAVHGCKPVV